MVGPGTEDSGSVSLADSVGQMFGDITSTSEPAPSSSTTEGTPPPSDAQTPAAGSPPPEGAGTAERPDTPPAAAASPSPDQPDGVAPSTDDPFKDAKPLTYTVDGQPRTYDGIKVLGEEFDGRGIIDAANLADIQRRLGERDHLVDANQQQYRTVQHYEKLAEWKTTDAEGKEQTASGPYGLVEMRAAFARQEAAIAVLDAVLSDPQKFAQLVDVDPATNKIILNAVALEYLQKDVRLAAQDAERTTRSQLAGLIADLNRPAAPEVNYSQYAPKVIEQAAGPGFAKLTEDDKQLLTAQMARYVRDTTPQERQAGQTSAKIVDASFATVVQHLVRQRTEAAKVAAVSTDAAASNAARLAAAARGTKPGAPVRPTTPTPPQATDADTAWDIQEKAAAAALRRRSA